MSFVTLTNYGTGYGSGKNSPYEGCQTSMYGSCETVGGYGNKNITYQALSSLKPLSVQEKTMMMTKQSSDRYTRLKNQLERTKSFKQQPVPKENVGIF
jgi:hypothetical protein